VVCIYIPAMSHQPDLIVTNMLPESTTVLIVGAGPTGLATAISLLNQGCRDIVIVDAVLLGENTSRAMAIHAATLEVSSVFVLPFTILRNFLRVLIQLVVQILSFNLEFREKVLVCTTVPHHFSASTFHHSLLTPDTHMS